MNKRNKTKTNLWVDFINNRRKVGLHRCHLSTSMDSFLHESFLHSQLQKLQKKTKIKNLT